MRLSRPYDGRESSSFDVGVPARIFVPCALYVAAEVAGVDANGGAQKEGKSFGAVEPLDTKRSRWRIFECGVRFNGSNYGSIHHRA